MAIGVIIQIALTLGMFYSAVLFVTRRLKLDGLINSLVGAIVLVISQQVFTVWVLGLIKHLWPLELFIFNVLISAGLIILSHPASKADFIKPVHLIKNIFSEFIKLLKAPDVLILFIIDALLLSFLLLRGIVLPPYAYDDHLYHLSSVGFMLQNGDLSFIPLYPLNCFPRNIELTYYFNDAFVHHQVYLNCLQIPYILLGILASYSVVRKAGISRHPALFAALTLPGVPIIIQQACTGYIDISVSVVFLCALNFLITRKQKIADVLLAGLALGIAAGGKGTMLIPVISVVLLWLILQIPVAIKLRALKRCASLLMVMVVAILLNGGWIYARNWVVLGNPVFPYEVKLGNKVIVKGDMQISEHYSADIIGQTAEDIQKRNWVNRQYYSFSEPVARFGYAAPLGGFGAAFFVVFLPTLLAAIAVGLLQRNWRLLRVLSFFLVPLIALGDMSFWQRYIIFFFPAGMVGFAYISKIIKSRGCRYMLSTGIILLTVTSIFTHTEIPSVGLENMKRFLNVGPAYWHASQIDDATKIRGFYQAIYPKYMKPGTTIFVDNSFQYHKFLALWNNDFSNRVVFTNAVDRDEWFDALDKSGADYLVISSGPEREKWFASLDPKIFDIPPGSEYSAEWVSEFPEKFRLKHQYGGLMLYEILE